MSRFGRIILGLSALLWAAPLAAQDRLVQTDWSDGNGTVRSTDLSGETGYWIRIDHMLHETVPGSLRAVQYTYRAGDDVSEVRPIRSVGSGVDYYAGGAPAYPAASCGSANFFLHRSTATGTLSWLFNANADDGSPGDCEGSLAATYSLNRGTLALALSDDPGGFATPGIRNCRDRSGRLTRPAAPDMIGRPRVWRLRG